MTNSSIRVASSLILLLFVVLGIDLTHIQAAGDRDKQIIIDKVEAETIKAENFGRSRGGGGGSRDGKWIIIEFTYEVKPDSENKDKDHPPYVDELTFKVNIEGRLTDGAFNGSDAKVAILNGEVTYVAVPYGKGFGCFYISPDVAAYYHLDRFLGQCNINVQALIGGQMVDSKDKKKDDENWFSRSDYKIVSGLIMTKAQSPFLLMDIDRYPTIKPSSGK